MRYVSLMPLALVLLLIGCSTSQGSPPSTPAPTLGLGPTVGSLVTTPTQAPTPSTSPTLTPTLAPTVTLEPTPTPQPTATPTPVLTKAEFERQLAEATRWAEGICQLYASYLEPLCPYVWMEYLVLAKENPFSADPLVNRRQEGFQAFVSNRNPTSEQWRIALEDVLASLRLPPDDPQAGNAIATYRRYLFQDLDRAFLASIAFSVDRSNPVFRDSFISVSQRRFTIFVLNNPTATGADWLEYYRKNPTRYQ